MKIELDEGTVKITKKDGKIIIETEEVIFNPAPQYIPPIYIPCDPIYPGTTTAGPGYTVWYSDQKFS